MSKPTDKERDTEVEELKTYIVRLETTVKQLSQQAADLRAEVGRYHPAPESNWLHG